VKNQRMSVLPIKLKSKARKAATVLQHDNLAIAVTLVESFFRPFIIRACEYTVWACLRAFSLKHSRITIGMSQIRADIVEKYAQEKLSGCSTINIILKLEQIDVAIDLAEYYIATKDRTLPISLIYTGKFNKYYEALVAGVLEEIKAHIEI
jgi:hypothetical protein